MCKNSVSALNGVGFAVLIIASLACGLSFVAPFWIVYPDRIGIPNMSQMLDSFDPIYPFSKASWRGLCAVCFKEATLASLLGQEATSNPQCVWFVQNNFEVEKSLPDWYLASQCLFAAGLAGFILALLTESFYACCGCCNGTTCNCKSCHPTLVASITITAAVLVAASLALYVGFSVSEKELFSVANGGHGGRLWWAFYVGVAGAGAAIVAAVLFYCDGCRLANIYHHYKPPTVDKA